MCVTDAATMFGLGLEELERMSGRLRDSAEMQDYLSDVVAILLPAKAVLGTMERAITWFRINPLAAFEGKTPNELVAAGRFHDVRRLVESAFCSGGSSTA